MTLLAQWEARQLRAERQRWLASSGLILLSGVALAVAMHWTLARTLPEPPPAAALMIDLALLPQAPEAPSAEPEGPKQVEAPEPEPEPPPPEPEPEPEPLPEPEPELPPSEIALPTPVPSAAPTPPPVQQPPAPTTSAPPRTEAPPSDVAAAPAEGAASTQRTAARLSFEQRLLGHLERHKRYPRAAQLRRQEGVPLVRFTMSREGRVLQHSLERGSGHRMLDDEALALLERAQPLPSLPDEMAADTLEVVVPIEFFLRR